MTSPIPSAVFAALALAACSGPAPEMRNAGTMTSAGSVETPNATAMADAPPSPDHSAPDHSGRWIGVEGMYLDVAPAGSPGHYRLEMQWDLDHKGTFDGTAVGDAIVFRRDGVRETLRPTDGDATGLKYLAGKTNCLTVKTGEGYCRDR